MSKSTFRILFYVRKNQVNKEGKASIMIRLTINGDTSQFSSRLEVEPSLWDVKSQKMSGSSLKARQLNSLLDDVRTSLKNHFHDIETHEAYVTAEKVRNAFLGITIRQQTLLETFRKHNEDVRKLVGISKSAATYAKYDRCMRRLEEFMQTKYRIKDIALKEISHVFITDFETYLRMVSRCNENTTAKFMQTFRMIIILAKNNGWIFSDPFINYKIRLKKVDRGYLTEPELKKILKKQFACKRLEQVRDIFIFSCFTGVVMNTVGNIFSGQVVGETAKTLSERFGKVLQKRQSISINRQDVSTSINTQIDALIPPSKISGLTQGMFVGSVSDNFNERIEQKIFHAEIVVDNAKGAAETKAYKPIPVITDFTDENGNDRMKGRCRKITTASRRR